MKSAVAIYDLSMKKSNIHLVPNNQLSLFDDLKLDDTATENLNLSNDGTDNNNEWGKSDAGQQQGSVGAGTTGELQGQATLFDAEGSTASTVCDTGTGRQTDNISQSDKLALLPVGERTFIAGDDGAAGRGNSVAGSDRKGRPVNYHNTQPFYENLSFGKERHLKDNINALVMFATLEEEKRPATESEQEILAKYSGWGGIKEILLDPSVEHNWNIKSDIHLRPLVSQAYEAINKLDPDGKLGFLKSAQRSIYQCTLYLLSCYQRNLRWPC